jgi:DNA-binding transcriptional ArsR family regulator
LIRPVARRSHRSIDDPRLDAVFAALADPTRRRIVARLARGTATVGELAEPFAMSLPAVSKHLGVLERAGLLRREVDGRIHRCTLDGKPLAAAVGFIEHYRVFWRDQLDRLADYLEDER